MERVTINEYSPMYIPLTNQYISRVYQAEIDTPKFGRAVNMFIRQIYLSAEGLRDIDLNSSDPEHAKAIVDIISDLNHMCVKCGHILQQAGCDKMLWEVKRKT